MSRADQFTPLPEAALARWSGFGNWEREYFPSLVGLVVEEVRTDYCRMRMPFRPVLEQPAGVVRGGAIATLLDSVVVPAIGAVYGPDVRYSTVDMHVQYLSAAVQTDLVAEGWIVRRGRTMVFCEAEAVCVSNGRIAARSILTYHVSTPAVSAG